jgi:hypothetical protein
MLGVSVGGAQRGRLHLQGRGDLRKVVQKSFVDYS